MVLQCVGGPCAGVMIETNGNDYCAVRCRDPRYVAIYVVWFNVWLEHVMTMTVAEFMDLAKKKAS